MNNYYWYEGKKIQLQPSTTHRAVRFSDTPSPDSRRSVAAAVGAVSPQSTGLDLGNGIILFDAHEQAPSVAAAGVLPPESSQLSVFAAPDSTPMILTEELIVQFKPEVSREQIDQFNATNKVKIISESEWERNSFVLAVQGDSDADALTIANRYHESKLINYAEPNFVRLLKPAYIPNDPLFPQQWALRNTGQGGGIVGQDIHAVNAWDITRGSNTVTIAIIDEGVDYTHPDLNILGKLVTGYDAVRRINDPTPSNDDAHGTACAGIAAATGNNGIGISGVAPNCRLMGVRIAYGAGGGWVTSDAQIADGINTAVARGADVLSNSWGGGSPSTAITNAIRNAKTAGRGGRGCVVCFAAGNGDSAVSYPGNLPEVITVAACNEWGERKSKTSRDGETWWGSNFGSEVDVSAPGVHITTTDIRGARGYNKAANGDYVTGFNGTSAATPHVAGVAALVLSVNPNLRAAEVEAILRASTDDIGSVGYDVYTGFGRINALKAVQASVLRWDSPRLVPGWFGSENQEGDIAVFDISRNGRADLLVFHIDNPGGENHGYYRIGWNLDNFGNASFWSPVKLVPGWFGAEDQGAGVALADINRNGTVDLLVFHVDNPGGDNHGYYRIGWNLNTAGDPTGGWSPIKAIPGWFGWENQGAGVALADINGNGSQDLIVYHIDNPGGENHGYYRIGWNLNAAGDVTGGWSAIKAIPGWFGSEDQGGGIAIADINGNGRPDLIVFHIDNPGGDNRGYYRIGWNLNAVGDVTGGWSEVRAVPGWFGWENQGGGVAVSDIDGNGRKDLVVYHIDNPGGENHGYYRIGWNLIA
jgi:subtilisin family serine protease/flagellar basal body rod protein FlgC